MFKNNFLFRMGFPLFEMQKKWQNHASKLVKWPRKLCIYLLTQQWRAKWLESVQQRGTYGAIWVDAVTGISEDDNRGGLFLVPKKAFYSYIILRTFWLRSWHCSVSKLLSQEGKLELLILVQIRISSEWK